MKKIITETSIFSSRNEVENILRKYFDNLNDVDYEIVEEEPAVDLVKHFGVTLTIHITMHNCDVSDIFNEVCDCVEDLAYEREDASLLFPVYIINTEETFLSAMIVESDKTLDKYGSLRIILTSMVHATSINKHDITNAYKDVYKDKLLYLSNLELCAGTVKQVSNPDDTYLELNNGYAQIFKDGSINIATYKYVNMNKPNDDDTMVEYIGELSEHLSENILHNDLIKEYIVNNNVIGFTVWCNHDTDEFCGTLSVADNTVGLNGTKNYHVEANTLMKILDEYFDVSFDK